MATARTDRSRPAPAGYRYVGPSSYAQAMDGRERREAQVRGKVQGFFDELRSALRRHVADLDPDQLSAFASRLRAHAQARKAQLEKKQDDGEDDTGDFDPAAWDQQFQDQAAGWVQDSYDGAADDMGDEADLPDDASSTDDGGPSSSALGRAAVLGLAVAGLWGSVGDSLDDADPTDPQAALDAVDGAMDGLDDTTDLISTDIGIGASNAGSLMAAGNASIDLEKQWFSAQDELVRPSHEDLDGDIEALDDEFANGLRYPGDEDGDVGEWINCRCTLLYLTPEGDEVGESDTGEAPPEPDVEASDMETAGLLLHLETQAFLQREAKQAELDVHASVGLYPRRVEFKFNPDQPRGADGRFGDTDSGSLKDTQNSLIMHFDANGEHTHSALREKAKGASGAWSVVDHRTGAKVTGIGSKAQAVNMLKSVTGAGKVSGGGSKPAGDGAKPTGSTKQGPTFNPEPNPNAAERIATFDKISEHFRGPTDSSYGPGQELGYKEAAVKRDTCDAIAARMGDQYDDKMIVGKPFGGSAGGRAAGIYEKYATDEDKAALQSVYYKNVTQGMYDRMSAEDRTALRSDLGVRQMVGNWAGSSNDKHDVTLALQETAIKEFGLERTRGWSQGGPGLKASINANIQNNGDMYSGFLRAMYDNTQQELRDAGIKEMRLYRGFKSKIPEGGGEGRPVSFKLRPMSSYAYQQHTAQSFMGYGNNKGWGAAATIPADRILSTARTGFGCLNENEVVVLGGLEPQQTWTRTQATGQSTYTGYGGYQSYTGPEFKYSPDQPRDDSGRFGEGDGDDSKDRRSEYATSTNTVDPRTGEKMSKTALGDAGEQAFEKVVAQDLHTVTGSKNLDNLNTEAGKRNVPLDFRSGTTGIEVKTISVDSRSQKAAISAEERQRKLDELPKIGADRAITVIQRYDPNAGSLEVRYHEGISSKSFNTATHIGSYDVGDLLR